MMNIITLFDSVIDAVAGVHYRPLDDPYTASFLRIPAGETQSVVPILLLRSKDLQERPYRLKLRLVPNENFAVDFDAPSKVRIINFSDIPSMPHLLGKGCCMVFWKI